jgi:hypothetical protein
VRVKEIAARLTIAETTVRNHIRPILRAFGATSQLQAVARASRSSAPAAAGAARSGRGSRSGSHPSP